MRFTQSWRDDGADEDGALAGSDIEAMRAAYQPRIDEFLAQYPHGLPSFDDAAEANRALGENNPALWRDSRFGEPNPGRLQSYYQVVRQNFPAIDADGNGELNWAEMANAREQALQDKQYALYYALDHPMRNGTDLFEGRGEGHDLHLPPPTCCNAITTRSTLPTASKTATSASTGWARCRLNGSNKATNPKPKPWLG